MKKLGWTLLVAVVFALVCGNLLALLWGDRSDTEWKIPHVVRNHH